jgi:hypothetical protein
MRVNRCALKTCLLRVQILLAEERTREPKSCCLRLLRFSRRLKPMCRGTINGRPDIVFLFQAGPRVLFCSKNGGNIRCMSANRSIFRPVRTASDLDFGVGGGSVKRFWARQVIRRSGAIDTFDANPALCRSFPIRSFGDTLSVRGQRFGCPHDAGSMQLRCAHLIGVLDGCRRRSGPRHHRHHVPAGPRKPAVRQFSVQHQV